MDYDKIKTVAYAYADRSDVATTDRYDDFLRIVEAKVNRVLKTLKMTNRATLPTQEGKNYYGLPSDFEGIRDLQINDPEGESAVVTLQYLTPEQLNEEANSIYKSDQTFYSIITNQLHIYPARQDNIIEMVYYKKVPQINDTTTTNWLSDENPDVYVFGVLVEIFAFVKDPESSMLWSSRYEQALGEIKNNDLDIRWNNGTPLRIRTV